MKALPLLFALIYHTSLIAQNTTFVTVKAGNKIRDVLGMADVYYYPQFTTGKVLFRNGIRAVANLNYNRLVDEMQFVDPKGDTLALANEETIKHISIGNDTFYYDGGYIRLIAGNNVVKLAEKQVWVVGDTRKIGAYNKANSTSLITAYSSYAEHGKSYDLIINEDMDLKKVKQYFLGDKYNRFVLASKKNLLMLFPEEERRIQTYLKEKKVDFTNKEDLEKVVQFLQHF